MDVSHFGLFDLTSRQPRWTGQPTIAPSDRVVPIGPVRVGVANDNINHAARRPHQAGPVDRGRPYKSLFRLVLHRSSESGQA